MKKYDRSTVKISGVRCKCRTCGAVFNSAAGFDMHRVGNHGIDRRCLTEEEMLGLGMALSHAGLWVIKLRDPDAMWPMAGRKRQ